MHVGVFSTTPQTPNGEATAIERSPTSLGFQQRQSDEKGEVKGHTNRRPGFANNSVKKVAMRSEASQGVVDVSWGTRPAMTWYAAIGCVQCPATFRGRTTAFPLSQIAIGPGCAASLTPARTRCDAPKVTAAAGELENYARRLRKRAVREVRASPGCAALVALQYC